MSSHGPEVKTFAQTKAIGDVKKAPSHNCSCASFEQVLSPL